MNMGGSDQVSQQGHVFSIQNLSIIYIAIIIEHVNVLHNISSHIGEDSTLNAWICVPPEKVPYNFPIPECDQVL